MKLIIKRLLVKCQNLGSSTYTDSILKIWKTLKKDKRKQFFTLIVLQKNEYNVNIAI